MIEKSIKSKEEDPEIALIEKEEKETEENKSLFNKNIIFQHEGKIIDSILVFKNGDFIIFDRKEGAQLFDRNTFKKKLHFSSIKGPNGLSYLSEEEFAILNKNNYTLLFLCKFSDLERTKYETLQEISLNKDETNMGKCIKLFNNDIINTVFYEMGKHYRIYRKENNEYVFKSDFQIIKKSQIVELNDKTIIGINLNNITDNIELDIYETNNYKVIKSNKIKTISDNIRRIYYNSDMIKVNNNKLIISGLINKIFIIDINKLTLETIIKTKNEILNIASDFLLSIEGKILALFKEKKEFNAYLSQGNFLSYYKDKLITSKYDKNFVNNISETSLQDNYNFNYYLKEISFDKITNDMTINKSKNITFSMGFLKNLFNFMPYINKGFIFISEQGKVTFYKKDILENLNNNKK